MEKEIYPITYRRLRSNRLIRELVSPLRLTHKSFIQPLFVEQHLNQPRLITHMNGVSVETIESIYPSIESSMENGINKFLLFPVPARKTDHHFNFTFASETVQKLKQTYGQAIWLATDVCLCSYTNHGHCGIMNEAGDAILNTESVQVLSAYGLELAQAGADAIAPSDMMDGRIKAIRQILNQHKLETVAIMSYSSKFSSQWYGPFRDACHSAPNSNTLKDRKSYQLSPLNLMDAIACAKRDEEEGADILMVKPATHYTDVIHALKQNTSKPVAAYHVSGEYAAIELMVEQGLLDRAKAHLELWSAFQRSGADIIISYAATQAKTWIENFES